MRADAATQPGRARLRARAPGKVNLCLFLGPVREDGRHELVTLFESVSVADEVSVSVERVAGGAAAADHVACPGVEGPNIVSRALAGLRERGWDAPAVRVEIRKQIPVAAGMGGGSADAAAVLRMAGLVAPVPPGVVGALAAELGADVPSQLSPGLVLGTGAGEVVQAAEPLAPHAFVLVPQPFALSTADVYREADRLGLPRDRADLAGLLRELRSALRPGGVLPASLVVNDLERAAVSLGGEIGRALEAVREVGAEQAFVCGSGPTVAGAYWGEDAQSRAAAGVAALACRYPGARTATPVGADFGTVSHPGGPSQFVRDS